MIGNGETAVRECSKCGTLKFDKYAHRKHRLEEADYKRKHKRQVKKKKDTAKRFKLTEG